MKTLLLGRVQEPIDHPPTTTADVAQQRRLPLKSIAMRLLAGLILVGFVVLVTVIFSFVGTITCCVLFGMMTGSLKGSRWNAVPISLVFPVVTVALLQFPSPAVSLEKAFALAVLCLAIFWVMYFLTRGLIFLEGKGGSPSEHAASGKRTLAGESQAESAGVRGSKASASLSSGWLAPSRHQSELEKLQGSWACQQPAFDGAGPAELIEFASDRICFKRRNSLGVLQSCWEGRVKCEDLGPLKTIQIQDVRSSASAKEAAPVKTSQTWVYRMDGPNLVVVLHLAQNELGKPRIENYRRVEST